jgi:hypothetical protein
MAQQNSSPAPQPKPLPLSDPNPRSTTSLGIHSCDSEAGFVPPSPNQFNSKSDQTTLPATKQGLRPLFGDGSVLIINLIRHLEQQEELRQAASPAMPAPVPTPTRPAAPANESNHAFNYEEEMKRLLRLAAQGSRDDAEAHLKHVLAKIVSDAKSSKSDEEIHRLHQDEKALRRKAAEAQGKALDLLDDVARTTQKSYYLDEGIEGRTRFFKKFAITYGVSMSCILYWLAVHTQIKFRHGRRGDRCGYGTTYSKLGKEIWLGEKQVRRLIASEQGRKLIGHTRGPNSVWLWIRKQKEIYAELGRCQRNDRMAEGVAYFYFGLADALKGVNPAIVAGLLAADPERNWHAEGVSYCLPWLSVNASRKILERLLKANYLKRERSLQIGPGRNEYCYHWAKGIDYLDQFKARF